MSATGPGSDAEPGRAYFEAIERTFIRLRGAPLLLSPADWQVAQEWRRRRIPVELVCHALEELFARRREAAAKGRINSLRYCAPAVERAWEARQELTAGGGRREPEPLDVESRLRELADSLPESLPDRGELAARIRALQGDLERIETALGGLEREVLRAARVRLDEPARARLTERAREAVGGVASRLAPEQRERLEEQVLDQLLRREIGLPPLTLFGG